MVGNGAAGGINGYTRSGNIINSNTYGFSGGVGGETSFTYDSVTYRAPGGGGGGGGGGPNSINGLGAAARTVPTDTGNLTASRDSAEPGAAGSTCDVNVGGSGGAGSSPNIQKSDVNWLYGKFYSTYRFMGLYALNNGHEFFRVNPGRGGSGGDGDDGTTSKYPTNGKDGTDGMVKIWWLYGPK